MRVGNDICPKCLSAHPVTMNCGLPTMTNPTTDRLAEVLDCDREAAADMSKALVQFLHEQGVKADYEYKGDDQIVQAFARHRIAATQSQQAEIERLTRSGSILLTEKHKEAAEARLWFTKAQEWKEEIERLREALLDARAFIDGDSPDWRYAKQDQLAAIDAALSPQPGKDEG